MLANILFSDLFSFLAMFSIATLILTCALHMVNINLLNGEINLGFTTSGWGIIHQLSGWWCIQLNNNSHRLEMGFDFPRLVKGVVANCSFISRNLFAADRHWEGERPEYSCTNMSSQFWNPSLIRDCGMMYTSASAAWYKNRNLWKNVGWSLGTTRCTRRNERSSAYDSIKPNVFFWITASMETSFLHSVAAPQQLLAAAAAQEAHQLGRATWS